MRSQAEFARLAEEWPRPDAPRGGPYRSHPWLYTWWRHVAPSLRPAILAVRENGRLVALAPLVRRGWDVRRLRPYRSLALLGSPLPWGNVGSDYLDLIVRRDDRHVDSVGLFDLDRKIRKVGKHYKQLIKEWREILPAGTSALMLV